MLGAIINAHRTCVDVRAGGMLLRMAGQVHCGIAFCERAVFMVLERGRAARLCSLVADPGM